jgi:hypothetical protein
MPCADIHIATMWGGIGWPFIPIICIGGIGAIFGGAFALLAPPLVPDAPPAASLDPPAPLAAGIIGIGHGIGGIGIGFPSGPIGIGGIFPPNGKPIIPIGIIPIGIPIGPTGIFFRDLPDLPDLLRLPLLPLPMPFGGIGKGIIMGNIAGERSGALPAPPGNDDALNWNVAPWGTPDDFCEDPTPSFESSFPRWSPADFCLNQASVERMRTEAEEFVFAWGRGGDSSNNGDDRGDYFAAAPQKQADTTAAHPQPQPRTHPIHTRPLAHLCASGESGLGFLLAFRCSFLGRVPSLANQPIL